MKKIVLLFALAFAFSNCKNESELTLTFEGKATNAQTGAAVAGAKVEAHYGVMCCGGIDEPIVGSASGKTDGSGKYSFEVEHEKKPVEAYRYSIGLGGPGEPILKTVQMQLDYSGFITEKIVAADYALPGNLADTVKIFDGAVWQADFEVLPAGKVIIKFPYDFVPATDTIDYAIYGFSRATNFDKFLGSWLFYPTASTAGKFNSIYSDGVNYIKISVRRPGGVVIKVLDTLPQVKHFEEVVYQVKI